MDKYVDLFVICVRNNRGKKCNFGNYRRGFVTIKNLEGEVSVIYYAFYDTYLTFYKDFH